MYIFVYIYIYILPIAAQTARPNWLTYFEETHGYLWEWHMLKFFLIWILFSSTGKPGTSASYTYINKSPLPPGQITYILLSQTTFLGLWIVYFLVKVSDESTQLSPFQVREETETEGNLFSILQSVNKPGKSIYQ